MLLLAVGGTGFGTPSAAGVSGAYEPLRRVREAHPPTRGGTVTEPDQHDAREGSGDPETDPAAIGEVSFEEPDADGGAVPEGADT